eukprot:5478757-Prymnesium_polylepis.1
MCAAQTCSTACAESGISPGMMYIMSVRRTTAAKNSLRLRKRLWLKSRLPLLPCSAFSAMKSWSTCFCWQRGASSSTSRQSDTNALKPFDEMPKTSSVEPNEP